MGADASGNVYVSSASPSNLKKFTANGDLVWDVDGMTYASSGVAFDPATDGADVYSLFEHYHLDYAKTDGGEASWVGHTIGAPGRIDPRSTTVGYPFAPIAVRELGSVAKQNKFLFSANSLYAADLAIYRLKGEVAVLVSYVSMSSQWAPGDPHPYLPAHSGWIWNDDNGDGQATPDELRIPFPRFDYNYALRWDVDKKGNLWLAENHFVQELPVTLNALGNPTYAFPVPSGAGMTSMPSDFSTLTGIRYVARTDTAPDIAYLVGWQAGVTRNPVGISAALGNMMARYDNWKTDTTHGATWKIPRSPPTRAAWTPMTVVSSFDVADDVAGGRVFVGHFGGRARDKIHVFDATTKTSLSWLKPGANIGGVGCTYDMPYRGACVQAGEWRKYVVITERTTPTPATSSTAAT